MTDQVKPGQVWIEKSSGARWKVESVGETAQEWLVLKRESGPYKALPISQWRLFDDYVLVKEAS